MEITSAVWHVANNFRQPPPCVMSIHSNEDSSRNGKSHSHVKNYFVGRRGIHCVPTTMARPGERARFVSLRSIKQRFPATISCHFVPWNKTPSQSRFTRINDPGVRYNSERFTHFLRSSILFTIICIFIVEFVHISAFSIARHIFQVVTRRLTARMTFLFCQLKNVWRETQIFSASPAAFQSTTHGSHTRADKRTCTCTKPLRG